MSVSALPSHPCQPLKLPNSLVLCHLHTGRQFCVSFLQSLEKFCTFKSWNLSPWVIFVITVSWLLSKLSASCACDAFPGICIFASDSVKPLPWGAKCLAALTAQHWLMNLPGWCANATEQSKPLQLHSFVIVHACGETAMVSGSRGWWDQSRINWNSLYLFSVQPQAFLIIRKYVFRIVQLLLALILSAYRKCAWYNGPVQRCCFSHFSLGWQELLVSFWNLLRCWLSSSLRKGVISWSQFCSDLFFASQIPDRTQGLRLRGHSVLVEWMG